MPLRLLRPLVLLGLLLAAGGGTCGAPQQLVILGHGFVSLKSGGDLIGPGLRCAEARCTANFDSAAIELVVEIDADDEWRFASLEGPGGVVGGGITQVTVDPTAGWTITVTFVENPLPDCTPTANPAAAPVITRNTDPVCIGKYANLEGTNLGGTGACVAFGDKLATEKFGTDTSVSATVPVGTPLGSQPVTLWTLAGSTSVNVVVSNAPTPTVPSPPASAPIGIPFALNGTGLSAVTGIRWELLSGGGGAGDATFSVVSDTELSVTIPSGTGTGSGLLRVGGDCGRAELMLQFTNAD